MKCRALKTLKTRAFHVKKGEVYDFTIFSSARKTGVVGPNGDVIEDQYYDIYDSVVLTDTNRNVSVTINYMFFTQNFATQKEERESKLKEILK